MKLFKIIVPALAVAALIPSCKTQYNALLQGNDVEAKYDAAFQYFNQGRYEKAAKLFESLAVVTQGTARDDTVQYYWALSNYRYKDYSAAQANFAGFLEHYPRSPFAEDAAFLRIDCLYRDTNRYELDQVPTYTAMTAISQYMIENPTSTHFGTCQQMMTNLSERLDKKAFENARLYYNMEDYKAAYVSFKNILKEDPDNIYREDIIYYCAMSSYKYAFNSVIDKRKDRYMIFADDYLNYVSEYPDTPRRKELDGLYEKAKQWL